MILSTDVWAAALIRRAELSGGFGVKPDGLVREIDRLDQDRAGPRIALARHDAEATRGDGERIWMRPTMATEEPEVDAYVARAARIDPDIWVVEVEDKQGRHFLTEPVEDA